MSRDRFNNAIGGDKLPDSVNLPVAAPPVKTAGNEFRSYPIGVDNVNGSTLVGKNNRRIYLNIINTSGVTIFLYFSSAAEINGNNGVPLNSGAYYSFENGIAPNTEINAIAAAAGASVLIVEGIL